VGRQGTVDNRVSNGRKASWNRAHRAGQWSETKRELPTEIKHGRRRGFIAGALGTDETVGEAVFAGHGAAARIATDVLAPRDRGGVHWD